MGRKKKKKKCSVWISSYAEALVQFLRIKQPHRRLKGKEKRLENKKRPGFGIRIEIGFELKVGIPLMLYTPGANEIAGMAGAEGEGVLTHTN
jgi:hypothetical protein